MLDSGVSGEMNAFRLFWVEYAQRDARFFEELHGKFVGIRVLVNNLFDARIDEHFGAHDARLRVYVDRRTFDVDTIARSLQERILFGVESTANLVALPRRHTELLAQAPRFGTMAKTGGHSVIARGKDAAILYDDRPYRTAQARSACCHLFGKLHEVLIPGRTRVNERTWCLLWVCRLFP